MINISNDLMKQIMGHAKTECPRECCGVISAGIYFPCRNLSESQYENFLISAQDFSKAEETGEITVIVHSHPYASPDPSQADLVGIESSQLPWIIVNPQTGAYTLTFPTGYRPPLLGREFAYGVLDCYTLVRDWYSEHGIELPKYDHRSFGWWDRGENLFFERFESAGFIKITMEELRHGDAVLMNISGKVSNHCAVYLGDNLILHHINKRLSSRDVYGGYWLKNTTQALRHKDMPC
jgi:proteasome lid subunit RPN8/RPN11